MKVFGMGRVRFFAIPFLFEICASRGAQQGECMAAQSAKKSPSPHFIYTLLTKIAQKYVIIIRLDI
jgi:hypothetical protein